MSDHEEGDGTRRPKRWPTIITERARGVMDWIFGYDYFIAYAHDDGKNYPRKLQQQLVALGYKVFLDVEGYTPGVDLQKATERRVAMSTYLLVVARRHALRSKWVRRELQVCQTNGRTPVAVNINGALSSPDVDAEIAELIAGRLHVAEALADPDGEPSEWVLGECRRSFAATRQETWRLRFLIGTLAAFLVLVIATGASGIMSYIRRMDAERQTRYAEAERLAQLSLNNPAQSPRRRLLLAVEAVLATRQAGDPPRPSAEQALRKALDLNGGRPLTEPQDGVGNASFSTDGQQLAVTDGKGAVWIWDVADPDRPPQVLRGPAQSLGVVAFSRDGNLLAAEGTTAPRFNGPSQRREDVDVILVWDLTTPTARPVVLPGHRDSISSLAFSPDGLRMASGSRDDTARVWDLRRPTEPPVILPVHEGTVVRVAFSPDGVRVITCDEGEDELTARIWELSNPSKSLMIAGRDRFSKATVSPDGRWLLFAGPDGSSQLLDLAGKDGTPVPIGDAAADLASADKSFSADGRWLASLGDDDSVLVWDLSRPGPQLVQRRVVEGRGSIVISPDGRRLAAPRGGSEPAILVWDRADKASDPVELRGLEGFTNKLIFSRDGGHLAALTVRIPGARARARLWDVNEPQGSHDARRNPVLSSLAIERLVLSPDARFLAAGCCDESIRIWDMSSTSARVVDLDGHQDYFPALAISPDGRRVASGDDKGIVRFWDLSRSPAIPIVLGAHAADFSGSTFVNALAFSPDGLRLASSGVDSTVKLWAPGMPGVPLRTWTLRFRADTLAFDPSGRRLAAGGVSSVWVFDLSDPKAISRETKGGLLNSSLTFSPNGRLLAAAGADPGDQVRIWELDADLNTPTLLPGYNKAVFAITFLPDGHHLATAEQGRVIKLWDLHNIAAGPIRWDSSDDVTELAVTPDSRRLIGGTSDGVILSWPLQLNELLRRAEHIVGRNLTLSEWRDLFADRRYRPTFPLLRSPGEPSE